MLHMSQVQKMQSWALHCLNLIKHYHCVFTPFQRLPFLEELVKEMKFPNLMNCLQMQMTFNLVGFTFANLKVYCRVWAMLPMAKRIV